MSYRQKEACEVVLDATLSDTEMSVAFPSLSKFDLGKKLADHYLRRFLQEERKVDEVGVIIIGGSGEEQDGSQELVMLQSATVDHRKQVADLTTSQEEGRFAGAFRLAVEKIEDRVKHYKFKRTILLITDGSSVSEDSEDDMRSIKEEFEQSEIVQLQLWGIDFDAEGRSEVCVQGQKVLENVFGKDRIKCVTPENAFAAHKRQVGQVKKWSGMMEVSSYAKFHVVMVARIAEERMKTLQKRSRVAYEQKMEEDGKDAADEFINSGNGKVQMNRKYVSSEDAIREVAPEERSRGYRYGKDILPVFPADEEAMRLEDTQACMKVIGIINRSELSRNYMISATNCVVANPDSENSQEGFSAFVRALRDLDKVATVRYVRKDESNPKFVSLIPGYLPEGSPAAGADCLWHIQLPTAEDIRDYPFESFSKYQISEREDQVAMDYVRAMTLVAGDCKETSRFDPERTFNPTIARYYDALHAKALEPEKPLPPVPQYITAMITPDPNVVKRSAKHLRNFSKAFTLRRVQKKRDRATDIDVVKSGDGTGDDRAATDQAAPAADIKDRLSALEDNAEWFADESKAIVDFIGQSTPVEDFWTMLKQSMSGTRDRTQEAFRGMMDVIRNIVGPQGDALFYDKAMSCLKAFREGALKYHGEVKFNEFMQDLKTGLLFQSMNDPFWQKVVGEKVTLISSEETNDVEDISAKDAEDFLSSSQAQSQNQTQPSAGSTLSQPRIFDDELFDEME